MKFVNELVVNEAYTFCINLPIYVHTQITQPFVQNFPVNFIDLRIKVDAYNP